MFEIDQYDPSLHAERPSRAEFAYSPSNDIAEVSFLVWGEHCTECAAPACYQTCDLYDPRPDSRCRRFKFGIYRNRHFASFRGYGAEVAFKKWGVLAAAGNTAMAPKSRVVRQERLTVFAGRILSAIGPAIGRLTRDERWQYPVFGLSRRLSSWLHRRNKGRTKPDAFLLEVYNPGTEPVRMQLGMDYAPEAQHGLANMVQIRPRFRTTVSFFPGYSRHEFDRRLFESFAETALPFNVTLTPEADASALLVFLSADFIRYRSRKTSTSGPKLPDVKCVVWDLDNTMWDGILVEDDDVRPKENVKQILRTLDRRGILCSIASKNNHEMAWQRLEQMGIAEFFLVPQINWSPKSESIRNIAKRLNIGVDTMAFVDDNPFELNEVGTAVPEVACISVNDVDGLLGGERFQGSKTADAQSRRRYYQEAIGREETQAEFGDDYLQFLAHCEIHLEVRGCREEDFDRVAELVQRTNQLNFSGHKYDRDQLRQILDDSQLEKYVLDCSDRFGAYGLIGFGLVRRSADAIEIQDLMLSCRVQGKLVEQAFFNHLETHHNRENARTIRVNFIETKRNQPARQALETAGLQKLEEEGGYAREIQPGRAVADIVRVTCGACCAVPATAVKG
jgi:FkbH-like protein